MDERPAAAGLPAAALALSSMLSANQANIYSVVARTAVMLWISRT
jgi:hypothetical protein